MYDFSRVSVLIIEDNAPMLNLTKALLHSFGFTRIYCADGGASGFQKYCSINPDIVITDWAMDDIDGIELTRLIRCNPQSPNAFTPVIMMTGFTKAHKVMEARDTGVTEFIAKPFTSVDILKRLEQVIEKPRQFVEAQNYFGPDRRRKKRVDVPVEFMKRMEDHEHRAGGRS